MISKVQQGLPLVYLMIGFWHYRAVLHVIYNVYYLIYYLIGCTLVLYTALDMVASNRCLLCLCISWINCLSKNYIGSVLPRICVLISGVDQNLYRHVLLGVPASLGTYRELVMQCAANNLQLPMYCCQE